MILKDISIGRKAIIKKINLDKETTWRLYNLGVTKNTVITCVFNSPFKSLRAYKVAGTTFALRECDAQKIEVAYE